MLIDPYAPCSGNGVIEDDGDGGSDNRGRGYVRGGYVRGRGRNYGRRGGYGGQLNNLHETGYNEQTLMPPRGRGKSITFPSLPFLCWFFPFSSNTFSIKENNCQKKNQKSDPTMPTP